MSGLNTLDQQTVPAKRFPWNEIFACAYGAGRGTSGTGDIAGYSVINSVYSLFNYTEGLQNPELAILRIGSSPRQQQVLQLLARILNIQAVSLPADGDVHAGIQLTGPWGESVPLRDLADGYKSTFLWIMDFVGWALTHQQDAQRLEDIRGIALYQLNPAR